LGPGTYCEKYLGATGYGGTFRKTYVTGGIVLGVYGPLLLYPKSNTKYDYSNMVPSEEYPTFLEKNRQHFYAKISVF
jgi:hypothetical protein